MAALTALDVNARQVMVVQGRHLVDRADNPAELAEEMKEFWAAVEREHRGAAKAKRADWRRQTPPPGTLLAAVTAELEKGREPPADNTLTKPSNVTRLMAEADKGEPR